MLLVLRGDQFTDSRVKAMHFVRPLDCGLGFKSNIAGQWRSFDQRVYKTERVTVETTAFSTKPK